VGRSDVKLEGFDEAGERRGLPGRQPQHEAAECGRVEDRVFEGPRQPASDDPRIEGVVGVLDENGSAREVEEGAAGVRKLRGVGDHLAIDLMAPARVGIDGGARVDQRVEEREGAAEVEALGADFEDEEGPVARRFDVERDVFGGLQRAVRRDRGKLAVWRRGPLKRRTAPGLESQYAFLCVKTRKRVIRTILRSNARLQFSM
jgi:hypothetical protein